MAWATGEYTNAPTSNEVRPAGATSSAVYCGGASLIAGAEAAGAKIFDGDPSGSGVLKYTLKCETANDTANWQPEGAVLFPNGLFLQVQGNGAVCYLLYK